ncbi:hypothetical protein V6N12_029866 [Hibiscus sabdariffa]|uniref:Uncharacterized protein n=1 Tax=Hibiscus sabdariffa TaxID=183260 RepID=A0ABR2CXE1_9ROSI
MDPLNPAFDGCMRIHGAGNILFPSLDQLLMYGLQVLQFIPFGTRLLGGYQLTTYLRNVNALAKRILNCCFYQGHPKNTTVVVGMIQLLAHRKKIVAHHHVRRSGQVNLLVNYSHGPPPPPEV